MRTTRRSMLACSSCTWPSQKTAMAPPVWKLKISSLLPQLLVGAGGRVAQAGGRVDVGVGGGAVIDVAEALRVGLAPAVGGAEESLDDVLGGELAGGVRRLVGEVVVVEVQVDLLVDVVLLDVGQQHREGGVAVEDAGAPGALAKSVPSPPVGNLSW